MVRSQFETEICLRLKLFEIAFDFSNLRNRPLHFRTADCRSNFRKNTDKYGHLATLQDILWYAWSTTCLTRCTLQEHDQRHLAALNRMKNAGVPLNLRSEVVKVQSGNHSLRWIHQCRRCSSWSRQGYCCSEDALPASYTRRFLGANHSVDHAISCRDQPFWAILVKDKAWDWEPSQETALLQSRLTLAVLPS